MILLTTVGNFDGCKTRNSNVQYFITTYLEGELANLLADHAKFYSNSYFCSIPPSCMQPPYTYRPKQQWQFHRVSHIQVHKFCNIMSIY